MRNVLFGAVLFFCAPFAALADGCYTCGDGSAPQCKDYCRYAGADTFDARKRCEKKGCKVSGTSSCPTAVNYKICLVPQREKVVVACAAPANG